MTAEPTARDVLAPILIALVDAAGAAARRVVTSHRTAGMRSRSESSGELDPEAVHDFRVALRRLRTLLRVARKVYGKKHVRPLEEGLRSGARATGTLRDEEVLRETLGALDLPKPVRDVVAEWQRRRARQERAHRGQVVRLLRAEPTHATRPSEDRARARSGAPDGVLSLDECFSQLRKRLEQGKARDLPAALVGREALNRALQGVSAFHLEDPDDAQAMHALRIRFKRLRYAAELFGPILGEQTVELGKSAARMQKRLGELHDIDEALVRMRRAWGLTARPRSAVIRALERTRRSVADRTRRDLTELPAFLGGFELP
jgi:CHAD domain-containing protein